MTRGTDHESPVATREDHPGSVLARLERPRGERTRFAVVADPHVSTREEGTSKLFELTEQHFAAAIDDIATRDVDAVLSPGDLTKDGELWNYEAVEDVLTALDAPFYAVPGNHDVPKDRDEHDAPALDRFTEVYTPTEPIARGPDGLSFRVRVGDLDVFGLNTSGSADRLFDSHEGHVGAAQREWLAAELDAAEDPLVLMHHNLPGITAQLDAHREAVEPEFADIPAMREGDALVETLAEGDVGLVCSGHYHIPAMAVTGGVREIATPTTCSFPQAYLLCDVTPSGTTVRFVPVADDSGLENAHARRVADSETARGLTAIAAARMARFPLVDEH